MSVFKFFSYLCNVKHSEIKDHIIETASNLFYSNGYNLTGINEIISEAGIAKATLYNHFKSKEDICVSYLRYKNSAFLKKIQETCLSKEQGPKQLLAVFDFLQAFFKEDDFNGCWCINTVSELPKENEKVRTEIQQQKQVFIAFLTELVENNLIKQTKKEAEGIARQVYLLYESAVSESHLHQNDWPIRSARAMCQKIIS